MFINHIKTILFLLTSDVEPDFRDVDSDFEEFVEMMMPSTATAGSNLASGGNKSGAGTDRQ